MVQVQDGLSKGGVASDLDCLYQCFYKGRFVLTSERRYPLRFSGSIKISPVNNSPGVEYLSAWRMGR
jgi:hypothetical protein